METLSAGYLERTTKEVLSFRMVVVDTSIFNVKMERPLKDQEINVIY
jgi:hypothetical protein